MTGLLYSIPSPSQSVWMLGPIPLRAYALIIVAGIILAWYIGDRRLVKKGGPEDVSMDIAVWMVGFGIIGARLYHVITTPEPYFGPDGDLLKIFRIWEGGLGIWGAIALGAIGALIGCRKHNLRFGTFADAFAPGIVLAQALGRWGNYFNQELFGGPTDLPWALEIDDAHLPAGFESGSTFHPTFLYESLWCVGVFFFLLWAERRFTLGGGQVMLLYVMAYTVGRGWIEYLRIDTANHFFGLRLNVWTSIIVFLAALIVFLWRRRVVLRQPELTDVYLYPAQFPAIGAAEADITHAGQESKLMDWDAEETRR